MKKEQKKYIRGSKDRPNDVRKILEHYTGKVSGIMNFTLNGIYFINHNGIIDYTPKGSELSQMITEYYHEVKLPSNLGCWKSGDILVNDKNPNEFYVFNMFTKNSEIFIYLRVTKSPTAYKASDISISDICTFIPSYTTCHKANDKELKMFYDILAAKNLTWDAYNKELHHGNHTYFYSKNGHYYFRRDTLRCKDRTTGEWYNAVLYSDANGQYVRELNDFNIKFRKI